MFNKNILGIVFSLGLSLTAPSFASSLATADWEKIGDSDGIEVFKMEIAGSPVVAFKGQGKIKASIAKVASIITDSKRAVEWVDRLKESRLVRVISDDEQIQYNHIGTPPIIMKDRDFVIRYKMEMNPEKGTFILNLSSVVDPEAPETDYVRGQILESSYRLKALNDQETYVIAEVHADPKGGVPKWVVNSFQKDWPVNTISSLRKQADKTDIQENPRFQKIFLKKK